MIAAAVKRATGYQSPATLLVQCWLSQVIIKGRSPPTHPAAKLCGSVDALFLVFAGKSSASSAVCGPTTSASIADNAIRMSVMEAVELMLS